MPGVFLAPQNGAKGFGYSHFVRRPAGNLVLDASRVGSLTDLFDDFAEMGGVKAAVISDRHLGGASTNEIAERFGATIYCSSIEAEAMDHRKNAVRIDHAVPLERTRVEGDVLLVPTPGHTAGQLSTLVEVEGTRILFTADFVWRENGRWRPGNLRRKKMLKSFEGLRDLAFDAVVPWTGYAATEFFVPVDDVQRTVDEMIAACPKP
ncbi:MAG TPA: MBL fold metallo-hydrolase [Caulobacteraceae bacterium]|nr:MBL fold metallo-hydrolase [Caulobacteraceae bacterium]